MNDKCNLYSNDNKLNFALKKTYEEDILSYFLSIDKSIYGNIKQVTDKNSYMSFDTIKLDITDELNLISKLERYSDGGYFKVINVGKKSSEKKLLEVLDLIKKSDIGFIKIMVGDRMKISGFDKVTLLNYPGNVLVLYLLKVVILNVHFATIHL